MQLALLLVPAGPPSGFTWAERPLGMLLEILGFFALIAVLRATPDKTTPLRVLGAIVPPVMWSLYYLAGQLQLGIRWPPEIWTGSIVLAMLSGVGVSMLAAPPSSPASRS